MQCIWTYRLLYFSVALASPPLASSAAGILARAMMLFRFMLRYLALLRLVQNVGRFALFGCLKDPNKI
jgi:hypothetical protein